MIQAFISTFPPRRKIFDQVLCCISPQVDRVVAVLNEYPELPGDLPAFGNIDYVVPEEDLKDVGKFYELPNGDDEIFLIDDDILYPATYVDHMRRIGSGMDMDRSVLGLQGHLFAPDPVKKAFTWKNILFHHGLDEILGADYLGTGTVYALGKNIADLDVMRGSQRFVDIRYAGWLFDRSIQCWVAPRPRDFLKANLPAELKDTSIYETFTRHNGKALAQETFKFILRNQHVGKVYGDHIDKPQT